MISDNFNDLTAFLTRFVDRLSPRERKRMLTKVGQSLRRSNSARIAANIQPDGTAMPPRRRRDGPGNRGKMFRRLRQARILKVRATADDVTVGFIGNAQKVAQVHHFGKVDVVGHTRDGRTIRARYVSRQLLGIGAQDERETFDAIYRHLSPDE